MSLSGSAIFIFRYTGLKLDLSYSSDAVESEALGYNDSYIHIYSNSWGPNDYGFTVEGPGTLLQKTFSNGATEVYIYYI